MAGEMKNKFVSWTLNVVKEIKEIPVPKNSNNIYGVGINLALVVDQPEVFSSAFSSSSVSSPSSATNTASSSTLANHATNPTNTNNNKQQHYNRVKVDSVHPDGPAAKAGLRSGDLIVSVDGKKFFDDDPNPKLKKGRAAYLPDDVAFAIRGVEGSEVGVVVERASGNGSKNVERIEFVLTREPIGVNVGVGVVTPPNSPVKKKKRKDEKDKETNEGQVDNEKQVGSGCCGDSPSSTVRLFQAIIGETLLAKNKKDNEQDCKEKGGQTRTATNEKETNDIVVNSVESSKASPKSKSSVSDDLGSPIVTKSEEEERKEDEIDNKGDRDLSSSTNEDADQFDDNSVPADPPPIIRRLSRASVVSVDEEIPEEKTVDDGDDNNHNNNEEELSSVHNNSSSICGVGVADDLSQQWEMISERSVNSAIVISISGSVTSGLSFRSSAYGSSPSMLKNKFVLTEYTGEPYIEHVVLPTDTLQGLCLAYKISATRLRMENNFSGNSLQMAPKKLRIPTDKYVITESSSNNNANNNKPTTTNTMMIRTQDKTSVEFKLYAFVAEIPSMELVEAKAYLDLSNWDLDEALRSAREDEGWSLKGGFEQQSPQQQQNEYSSPVAEKPKSLTARDIHAALPAFEGDGFELKDIRRCS